MRGCAALSCPVLNCPSPGAQAPPARRLGPGVNRARVPSGAERTLDRAVSYPAPEKLGPGRAFLAGAAHIEVQVIVSRRKPGPAHSAVMAGIARMRRFQRERAEWIREHPGATADELRRALDQLAARLTPGA